jgi:hypothetical protein
LDGVLSISNFLRERERERERENWKGEIPKAAMGGLYRANRSKLIFTLSSNRH